MKSKILLITIFLSLGTYTEVHSQDVFPASDAIWNIKINNTYYLYGLIGDTIIDDIVYNKLYSLNDCNLDIDVNDEYMGGFRQENGKVWFRPNLPADMIEYLDPMYPKETILYDFSKNVGDTIWHNIISSTYLGVGSSTYYDWIMKDSITASIITAIDETQQIYETKQYLIIRDFIPFGTARQDTWIKGVGGMHGLFWFLTQTTSSGYPSVSLMCLKQGDEIKYIHESCISCCPLSENTEKQFIPLTVTIQNNQINLSGDNSVFPIQLRVFNATGQLLFIKEIQTVNENIAIQYKGLLLYKIQKNNEIIQNGKLIVK